MSTATSVPRRPSPGPASSGGSGLSDRTDAELLRAFERTGSAEAFGLLVQRHGPMVHAACARVLGNAHDAEDAAQAVFLVLARRPGAVRGSPAGWLYAAATNAARNLLQQRTRRGRREQAAARPEVQEPAAPADVREVLDAALAALPAALREAVVLCHLEGRSQEEAARLLGCHQGTLSRHVSRGLERLRRWLTHRGVVVTPAVLVGVLAREAAAPAAAPAVAGLCTAGGRAAVEPAVAALAAGVAGQAAGTLWVVLAAVVVGVAGSVAVVSRPDGPPAPDPPAAVQTREPRLLRRLDFTNLQSVAVLPDGVTVLGVSAREAVYWHPDGRAEVVRPAARLDRVGGAMVGFRDGDRAGVWDAAARRVRWTARPPEAEWAVLAVSPRGDWLMTKGPDARVRAWRDGGVAAAPAFGAVPTPVVGSPDGRLAAWADPGRNGAVRLWDCGRGRWAAELPAPARPEGDRALWRGALAFSGDGRRLASAWYDGRVEVWDPDGPGRVAARDWDGRGLRAVALGPDGRRLAAGGDTGFHLWDLASGAGPVRVRTDRHVRGLAFAPDGRTLAVLTTLSGGIELWDVPD